MILEFALTGLLGLVEPNQQHASISSGDSLTAEVLDAKAASARRNSALAALERLDFAKAADVAELVLDTDDQILRARAAWITAAAGKAAGVQVLRAMATEEREESVIAIETLGRLRDPGAHSMLRGLMETELSRPERKRSAGVISAVSGALADYGYKTDAALLARSVAGAYGPGSWVRVTDAGRTGGSAAVPTLEDIFDHGKGWTVMAAGLASARCGSPRGLQYVRRWLEASTDRTQETLTDAGSDDPHGPKATDFILQELGVTLDEIFVPELLQIINQADQPPTRKEQAWTALLRMNIGGKRREILQLAWASTHWSSAARKIIVLNDEAGAREYVAKAKESKADTERRIGRELANMLARPMRARHNWLLIHGYTF